MAKTTKNAAKKTIKARIATVGKAKASKAVKAVKAPQNGVERNYAMDKADVAACKKEGYASAYNKGAYHFSLATLEALGTNKWHTLAAFRAQLQKTMGADWKAFESREARNAETGKDVNGRILQNLLVLQRVKDYGLKLTMLGACIDLRRNEANKGEVRLNTKSVEPMKLGRKAK